MARPRKAPAATIGNEPDVGAEATVRKSSRTSSRRSTAVILDSKDELPTSELSAPISPRPGSTKQSFKGVFIPPSNSAKTSATPASSSKMRLSAPSSVSSLDNGSPFTRDNSEIETAATSRVSTPADNSQWPKRLFPKSQRPQNANQTASPTVASAPAIRVGHPARSVQGPSSSKRKAPSDNDTSADADLARALQEEEYAGPVSFKRQKTTHKRRLSSLSISDTMSSTSEGATSPGETSDSDVPLQTLRKGKGKAKASSSKRKASILPKRRARASAQAALTNLVIDDSEDESALSDFLDLDDDGDAASKLYHFDGDSLDEEDDSEIDEAELAGRLPAEDFETFSRRTRRGRKATRAVRERKKLEKAHPEILTMWTDLEAVPRIAAEAAEQPESISRKLKSFQLEGLNWMKKQEQTQWKGGLLGDEMGMGKTIQAVSLIMSDYPTRPHQPTLVVVPPVALMQWTNEIRDYTSGQLKVLVYHGSNSKSKRMSVKELKAYDVIMVSYSGLESVFRKQNKGWVRGEDIIKEDSALHSIHFHRLILDEAHSIKSRTAGVAKACFALKGTYKWCLSGTPVQNRIGEFFSLLRFLNIKPFANYLCKKCPCATPDWSTTGDYKCTHCMHRSLDHVSVFNQEILNPVVSGETETARKEGLAKLRLLTDRIMLRRTKRDHTSSMELPPKEIVIHNEFFGEIERDFSSSIMTNTNRQFDTYVSRGVMLNNYANIFGLIMQMRQVANHPDLLLKKHAEIGQNVLVCNICDEPAEEAVRSRCKHEFCRVCVKDYVMTCEASDATPDCPRCHIALSIDFEQPDIEQDSESVKKSSIINRIKMENWHSSTKIEMLVYDLYKLRSNKQTLKSIVFSQFTSMLQLIEWRLRRAGFNTVMLDGSMTPQQRQKSIEYFMNNTDVEVFLVSLKAGGVALNLTEASRVFIVDPWWNPAAEWQSADRCHRIGQKRPCVITRLVIEDSVESRIVLLQEKKTRLIQGTVDNESAAMEKLTPEDMQFLFRGT